MFECCWTCDKPYSLFSHMSSSHLILVKNEFERYCQIVMWQFQQIGVGINALARARMQPSAKFEYVFRMLSALTRAKRSHSRHTHATHTHHAHITRITHASRTHHAHHTHTSRTQYARKRTRMYIARLTTARARAYFTARPRTHAPCHPTRIVIAMSHILRKKQLLTRLDKYENCVYNSNIWI